MATREQTLKQVQRIIVSMNALEPWAVALALPAIVSHLASLDFDDMREKLRMEDGDFESLQAWKFRTSKIVEGWRDQIVEHLGARPGEVFLE